MLLLTLPLALRKLAKDAGTQLPFKPHPAASGLPAEKQPSEAGGWLLHICFPDFKQIHQNDRIKIYQFQLPLRKAYFCFWVAAGEWENAGKATKATWAREYSFGPQASPNIWQLRKLRHEASSQGSQHAICSWAWLFTRMGRWLPGVWELDGNPNRIVCHVRKFPMMMMLMIWWWCYWWWWWWW